MGDSRFFSSTWGISEPRVCCNHPFKRDSKSTSSYWSWDYWTAMNPLGFHRNKDKDPSTPSGQRGFCLKHSDVTEKAGMPLLFPMGPFKRVPILSPVKGLNPLLI